MFSSVGGALVPFTEATSAQYHPPSLSLISCHIKSNCILKKIEIGELSHIAR